jgi:hypothetical protein
MTRDENQPQKVVADVFIDRRFEFRKSARVIGYVLLDPLVLALERGEERLLREIFGEPDVANHAQERANQASRFDSPARLDGRARGRHRHHLTLGTPSRALRCRA